MDADASRNHMLQRIRCKMPGESRATTLRDEKSNEQSLQNVLEKLETIAKRFELLYEWATP